MSFERDLAEKALVEVWASLIDLSDVVAVRALARLALASPRLAKIECVWTVRPLYEDDGEDPNFVQEPFEEVWRVRSMRLLNLKAAFDVHQRAALEAPRCLAEDLRGPDSPVTPTNVD